MKKAFFALILASSSLLAFGQNQQTITDGTTFINGLQPTQPGQLVNPSGATSQSWTGKTTLGTTVPAGLGSFSNPNTTAETLNQAKTVGLSGLGNSAMTRCESYVPTGDGVKDQECAAVNFLSNKCFTATNAQAKITGPNNNGSAPGCEGTFGAGHARNIGFTNTMKPEENIFDPIRLALHPTENNCSTSSAIAKPAQYKKVKGIVSTSVDDITCSQYLSATVTQQTVPANISGYTCPNGTTLDGSNCLTITTAQAAPNYGCPTGQRLDGTNCIDTQNVSQPASITSYTCPTGWTPNGSSCTQLQSQTASVTYFCPSTWSLAGSTCSQTTITSYTASINYGCTPPATLNGTNCNTTATSTKPATIVSYVCPAGWSVNGSSCIKTTTTAATVSSYGCPVGWSVNGSSCTLTQTAAATVNYACPAGWSQNGTSCSKTTTTTTAATPQYFCPSGGSPSGNSCTTSSPASVSLTCPAGWQKSGNICTTTATTSATLTNSCNGLAQYGNYCIGRSCYRGNNAGRPYMGLTWAMCAVVYGNSTNLLNPIQNYTCPADSIVSGSTCIKTSSQPATENYFCPSGSLSGGQCVSTYTATISNYVCPAGQTVSGSSCIATSTSTQAASISYTCSSGWSQSGSSCSLTSSQAATPAYVCSSGWNLIGSTCSLNSSQGATPVYACATGESLNGNSCTVTNTTAAPATVVSYFCPAGGTLTATNCVTQSTATQTPSASYYCATGWTLNGTTCTVTNTQAATPNYVCPIGSTLVIDQCKSTQNVLTPATVASYSCPSGWVLNITTCTQTLSQEAEPVFAACADGQTPVAGICTIKVVSTSWRDTCKDYAQSAGVNITPQ